MDFPLADLYEALGDLGQYKPNASAALVDVHFSLDARPTDVLGGEQISTRYEVRVPKASVGGAVLRGAVFVLGGVSYEATAKGQPSDDGSELIVPVRVLS